MRTSSLTHKHAFNFCLAGIKRIRNRDRIQKNLILLGLTFLFHLLPNNIAFAQPDGDGVWRYNPELEGHLCDDGCCYTFCTSSYMENSFSANDSKPSSALKSAVANWMSKIDGNKKIRDLSIPGTHDSGAQWGGSSAETQSWDISQQLEGGIRYFDIRLKANPDDPDGLAVYHGDFPQCHDPDCGGACGVSCDRLTFTQILTWMSNFLELHPEEAIIMRVFFEVGPTDSDPNSADKADWTRRFNNSIWIESNDVTGFQFDDQMRYPIYNKKRVGDGTDTHMPILDSVRGKIWIHKVKGHDETIPINLYNGVLKEQNNYNESLNTLSYAAVGYVDYARYYIAEGKWVQNWCNGIHLNGRVWAEVPSSTPADVASYVNKDVFHALNEKGGNQSVGTILMDFPGEGLIYRIIKRNFVYEKLVDLTVAIDCHHSLLVGGASDSRINVKLYNGGQLIGQDQHVAGCSGLGDSFYQIKSIMRAMPQDYTHFMVTNLNPKSGDALGIDEIYISQTRYGLDCYNGGVVDDELEKWGVDGGSLWCLGRVGDDEYGSDAATCQQYYTYVSGRNSVAYYGEGASSQKLIDEMQYYTQSCIPLESQAYTVKNQPTPAPVVAICGEDAPPVIFDKSDTLFSDYTVPYRVNMIIESGVVLTIPYGVSLTIGSESKLLNHGVINNLGKLIVNSTAILENKPEATINSVGQFFNIGKTVNEGRIFSPVGYYGKGMGGKQTLINPVVAGYLLGPDTEGGRAVCEDLLRTEGTTKGGEWNAALNTCTIENFWIQEDRTLLVDPGITLVINGLLSNNGIIDNHGTVDNENGTINQCGTWLGIDPFSNPITCFESEEAAQCSQLGGQWNPELQACYINGASSVNAGTILTISPEVTYYINGTLTNDGTIVNTGNLINYGNINNGYDGNIYNENTIIMDYEGESGIGSVLMNDGAVYNSGYFQNVSDYSNGGIIGSGFFNNQCEGVFTGVIPEIAEFYVEPYPESLPPKAIAQDFLVVLDSAGNAESVSAADIDNGSTDNCGIDTISISQANFNCSHLGENIVILTVTDHSGNQATDTAIVTVEDYFPPVIEEQSRYFTLALDSTGFASLSTADLDIESSDVCGIPMLTLSQTEFSRCDVGSNSVILTATDHSGNQSKSSILITVEDNFVPSVSLSHLINCGSTGTITVEVQDTNDTYSFDNGVTFGTSNIKSGLEAGSYQVITKTIQGCTSVATEAIITFQDLDGDGLCDELLGIEDEFGSDGLTLYPNPVSHELAISSERQIDKVEFYSFIGRKLKEVGSGFEAINVEQLSDGIYFIRIYTGNDIIFKRLIKN